MMDLHQILHDYLTIRRSLGFKLEREGALLPRFIAFLEEADSTIITTTLALAWATRPTQATPKWWATRLGMVRGFAAYAHGIDPHNEVPPPDLLPCVKHRSPPYIYRAYEVLALMAAADRIHHPFRAQTFRTLIGLLASTGMRVGEAIALDRTDLDTEDAILTVRDSKFGTSRYLPLHPSTVQALRDYAASRNRYVRRSPGPAFFVSLAATRLIYQNVHSTFFRLVDQAGLAHRKPQRPRIHDLRHTFAVRTLIDWHKKGLEVEPRLPALSTYLGHVDPSGTYWYLSAVPELVGSAVERLERKLGG
ncbi:MAG: tyrosine-type recombinase/integrase [Gemmatimonadota bacterium]|jgi:integrase